MIQADAGNFITGTPSFLSFLFKEAAQKPEAIRGHWVDVQINRWYDIMHANFAEKKIRPQEDFLLYHDVQGLFSSVSFVRTYRSSWQNNEVIPAERAPEWKAYLEASRDSTFGVRGWTTSLLEISSGLLSRLL